MDQGSAGQAQGAELQLQRGWPSDRGERGWRAVMVRATSRETEIP